MKKASKNKRQSVVSCGKKGLLVVGAIFLSAAVLATLIIVAELPSPTRLLSYDIPQTTEIFDRNGELLYQIYTEQNRTLVDLDNIPLYLRQATISIEDKDFYHHKGIDPIGGILRAIKETVFSRKLQGGSTITQQLVKNALLTPERTLERKVKELILAFWTERLYSKDEILEMYLNQVPYGGTAWGIEAAAETYFGKSVSHLTLAEAALLAGLPAAPTRYSPFGAHPELSQARQEEVLRRMVEDGYITESQKSKVKSQKLEFRKQTTPILAPHFVMYVKDRLVEKYGQRKVEQGGLKVTTTLALTLQEVAQATVAAQISKLENLRVGNGAVLVTRPPTGEILAMVGSKDYFATPSGNFNVVTALRQPGSAIKPINYAVGLETKKVTPATVFIDAPTCFSVVGQKPYCPVNYDGQFHGPQQLRFALGNSYNIPAVKMMAVNGVETVIASASAMAVTSFKDPSNYGLSLTLGGGEVSMLDMATAFAVFANTGVKRNLESILKVEDKDGNILEEFKDPNFVDDISQPISYPSSVVIPGERVLSAETSFLISHILLDNNARSQAFGPFSSLVISGHAVSVKTGTTDDKRDNWTIGFTPNFLIVVWVGNNDNSPMHPYLASGVTGAAPIWNQVTRNVLANQADLWPKQPTDIVGVSVCNISGLMPPSADNEDKGCGTRFEYFIKGTVPSERENLKKTVAIDKSTGQMARSDQTDNIEMQEHQVASDMFSTFCLDCPTEGDGPVTTVRL